MIKRRCHIRACVPVALASAALLASGCATHEPLRTEAVSFGAGDAVAANTVMQMVDPWPRNVQYTDIIVPADHDQYRRRGNGEPAAADAAQADGVTY